MNKTPVYDSQPQSAVPYSSLPPQASTSEGWLWTATKDWRLLALVVPTALAVIAFVTCYFLSSYLLAFAFASFAAMGTAATYNYQQANELSQQNRSLRQTNLQLRAANGQLSASLADFTNDEQRQKEVAELGDLRQQASAVFAQVQQILPAFQQSTQLFNTLQQLGQGLVPHQPHRNAPPSPDSDDFERV